MLAEYLCAREGVRPHILQSGVSSLFQSLRQVGRGWLGLKAAVGGVLTGQVKDVKCDFNRVGCLLADGHRVGAYC